MSHLRLSAARLLLLWLLCSIGITVLTGPAVAAASADARDPASTMPCHGGPGQDAQDGDCQWALPLLCCAQPLATDGGAVKPALFPGLLLRHTESSPLLASPRASTTRALQRPHLAPDLDRSVILQV